MKLKLLLGVSLLVNLVLIFLLVFKESPSQKETTLANTKTEGVYDMKGNLVPEVSVVMLGNSITYQGSWSTLLNRDDVFNGGKPGWTTQQLSWVIKDFIIPNKPKICFFKGGTNDISLGIPTSRIVSNMKMVMDSINRVGTIPVYTPTVYFNNDSINSLKIDSVNNQMMRFCESKNYQFMDIRDVVCANQQLRDKYYKDDNTHLKQDAYLPWAAMIQKVLKANGI